MCGVAGMASMLGPDPELVRRMCDVIAHRGPDGEGFHHDEHVALGMRRLAIVDVAGGDQPVHSEDGRVAVIGFYDIGLIETTETDPAFAATLRTEAAYAQMQAEVVAGLEFSAGARFERGDQDVRSLQVLNLLNDLKKEFGFTVIFISHDLSVVRYISDRIMVMNKGKIIETGDAEEIYRNPKSTYTQQLINSIPNPKPH